MPKKVTKNSVGKVIRHFKGNNYKVLMVAQDCANAEEVLVYEALYGDHKIWVRPLTEFTEDVSERRDNVTKQTYRFEEV